MQVSDSQNADEISKILALLQAKDKKTNLYRAFDQCLKYVEAESQKERQIVLVISDGIQDTGDAGITQEELETRLTQASMPVYAFVWIRQIGSHGMGWGHLRALREANFLYLAHRMQLRYGKSGKNG